MFLVYGLKSEAATQFLSKASFILLCWIALTLPLGIGINSVGIIIFAVSVLFRLGAVGIYNNMSKMHLLFIAFYLLHVVGLLYTTNLAVGGFDLEKKLALIIFPIFLGAIKLSRKRVNIILLSFVVSCFILINFMLLEAAIKYYLLETNVYFFSGRLSEPAGNIHRVYFAMYLLFGMVSCIYLIQSEWNRYKYFFIIAILFFSLGVFLLSARMCFIIYVFLFIRYLYYFVFVKKILVLGILAICIALISFASIATNKQMIGKLTQTYTDLDKGNSKRNTSSANLRVIKWKCALATFKDNFMIGTGTGDVNDELVKSYIKSNFYWGMKEKFNAHNQYLETAIAFGILGLAIWLMGLIAPIVLAVKFKQYIIVEFIFIFAFCCLTESMLCAQKGVVFYAFFNSLLVFQLLPKKE